jgi:hypothetical protein
VKEGPGENLLSVFVSPLCHPGRIKGEDAMEEPYIYVPRPNDPVFLEDGDNRLIVVHVNASRKTAALKTLVGPVILYENVPWSKICPEECNTQSCAD